MQACYGQSAQAADAGPACAVPACVPVRLCACVYACMADSHLQAAARRPSCSCYAECMQQACLVQGSAQAGAATRSSCMPCTRPPHALLPALHHHRSWRRTRTTRTPAPPGQTPRASSRPSTVWVASGYPGDEEGSAAGSGQHKVVTDHTPQCLADGPMDRAPQSVASVYRGSTACEVQHVKYSIVMESKCAGLYAVDATNRGRDVDRQCLEAAAPGHQAAA